MPDLNRQFAKCFIAGIVLSLSGKGFNITKNFNGNIDRIKPLITANNIELYHLFGRSRMYENCARFKVLLLHELVRMENIGLLLHNNELHVYFLEKWRQNMEAGKILKNLAPSIGFEKEIMLQICQAFLEKN